MGFEKLLEEAKASGVYYREMAVLDFTIGLTKAMKAKGVSMEQLAERTGISLKRIKRMFAGGPAIKLIEMVSLALAVNSFIQVKVLPRRLPK